MKKRKAQYETVFDLIAAEFPKAKISYILIGGFAVNYYKVARMTADVDILIDEADFQRTLSVMSRGRYRLAVQNKLFARFVNSRDEWMELDVMFVDAKTFNGIFEKSRAVKIQSQYFRVPCLEHLIALKLHSVKNNPEAREYKDLGDIRELVKQNGLNVRSARFRNLCLQYGSEQIYQKLGG